ncbi:MAG: sterol desaturase family protein, partial [Bdellovibrionales bacterium]|nr:sterol desaturase family protein [Bdellovibrionales bacterium]
LEVITSFYKHPLEMIFNSIIGSLLIYTILGLSLEAGAIYTLFTALGEFFYHTNIKTPQWIGYIFQRPEMHRIHHQYDYHKNNYGDFVFWDMIFGTYENPKTWSDRCGFTTQRELRLKEMLLFRDVHKIAILVFLLIPTLKANPSFASIQYPLQLEEVCSTAKGILKEGDLIFIDIPNFLFREVASSTQSWTSHVGIVFKNKTNQWVVYESKIPLSKQTPLCEFLKRSAKYRFEIRRYLDGLDKDELLKMKSVGQSLMGRFYNLGFNLDSDKLFCSKFVYMVYQSIGISIGKVQTFKELLDENSNHSLTLWRLWFLGHIPWDRRTVTPASQLLDSNFHTVLEFNESLAIKSIL